MKNRYHVPQKPDGTWQGKLEGAERASTVGETKAEVQQRTIEIAKEKPEAQVIIHKADGRIQEERTYPGSKDPRETKG